ncbi:MAG: aspartate--tRNA ligase [bacterium]
MTKVVEEEYKNEQSSYRDYYCTRVTEAEIGDRVTLSGWIDSRRDHGGVIFVDLRDRTGIVQVVFDREFDPETHDRAGDLRKEWVITVEGTLAERSEETVNPSLKTGTIEVEADDLTIHNQAETPPFILDEAEKTRESLRLEYRYLDLRRPELLDNFKLRHRVSQTVRRYLDEEGFLEIETPYLTRSTPEGARDYVVPSRVHPGEFYALPQSPQLFKQLLMCSGMDRYFQIVKCFRDEDLRADRQPEFTQIDIEASFIDEEDIYQLSEGMIEAIADEAGLSIPEPPFPRMTFREAISRYGTDRPDTRFGLELTDVTHVFDETELGVFESVIEDDGVIKTIVVPGGAGWSRSRLDQYVEDAQDLGAQGLAWIKLNGDEWQSPIAKFLSDEEKTNLQEETGFSDGDCILFMADQPVVANRVLGSLRVQFAQDEGLIPEEQNDFVWITKFPLLEYDEDEGRYAAMHHPFTAPTEDSMEDLPEDPENALSRAYDLVWNGVEIGGGSIRNHTLDQQELLFETLGIGEQEAEEKFGFFTEALQYGAPPHGGIAFGYDRLLMLMAGADSIRDVIAFPKTQRASDLMTNAPAPVDADQLDELHLQLAIPDENDDN